MPKRMLDGGICTSESLNRVSIGAEVTFVRLVSLCDDHGRYDARLRVLKAHLFPLRDEVSGDDLYEWINELVAEGCIHPYELEGKRYIHLPSWGKYQRLRESHAKWPDPKGNCHACGNSPQPAATRGNSPPEVEARSEKREYKSRAKRAPDIPSWALTSAELLASLLLEIPGATKPKSLPAWAREIAKIPKKCPQDFRGECIYSEVVDAMTRWALGPENLGQDFEVVIRSGGALLAKWPKLVAARERADRKRGVTTAATAADRKRGDEYAQRKAEDEEQRQLAARDSPEDLAKAIEESRETRAKQPKRRLESV